MTESTLSGQEEGASQTAEQIFAEMSKAVAGGDDAALDRLTKSETPIETAQNELEGKEAITPNPSKEEEVTPEDKAAKAATSDDTLNTEDVAARELDKLKEEIASRDRAIHQLRSDAGRVPALRRQIEALDRQLKEVANKPTTDATKKEESRLHNEKLARIKEADPLLAEAIEELFGGLRQETESKLEQTQAVLRARADKEDEEFLDREYTKLVTAVPNAPEVFAHPLWTEWKEQIPPNLLALAKSPIADEVMVAFDLFGKFVLARHPELAQKKGEETPNKEVKVTDPSIDKVVEERERKLRTPTPGAAKVVAESTADITDPEKLFELAFNKEIAKYKR